MSTQDASTTRRANERLAFACASAATLLGGLGLLGWMTPWRALATLSAASVPMAPSTALACVLLGGTLMLEARFRSRRLTTFAASLVLVYASLHLAAFLAVVPSSFYAFVAPAPETALGVVTGRMSPLTALGLLLASLGLLFVGPARAARASGAAGAGAAVSACLLALVVALGYLFGAPLLYASSVVSMALSTALGIGFLGLALMGLMPASSSPLRPLTGSSAQARLLRALLPIAPAIVAVEFVVARVRGLDPRLQAPVAALLSAVLLAAGAFYAAYSVAGKLDSAQAERERALGNAERLAAIVRSSSDAIYAKSLGGTIVAWNAGAERIFGYSPDEIMGRSAELLLPPGARDEFGDIIETVSAGEHVEHKQTERLRKDGTHVPVSLSESPLRDAAGQVVGISAIARDASAQVHAEAVLRQSEADFRLLAQAMPQMVWVARPDGSTTYLNLQWMEYTGLGLEESLGQGWHKMLHPDDEQPARDAWQRAVATLGTYSVESRLRRADGAYLWFLVRGVPVWDAAGTVIKWFGTCTDIDDLKRAVMVRNDAERRLLESEEEYRLLFDANPHPMWLFDTETLAFLAVNDAAVELYGFSRDEFLGMTIEAIRPANQVPGLREYVSQMPDSPGLPAVYVKHRKKDGTLFEVDALSNAIKVLGRPARLVLVHDTSSKRQLEAQLLQSQKMEAVGRLAGGVAHDFNNQLGVILGYTELLLHAPGEGQRAKLEQILKATQRASDLTRQLLVFSRKQVIEPKVLDLNALVSNLEKMLVRLIGEDIDLAIVLGADLGQVLADPGQLEQVVMNLCVNARDAMPDGGPLRIETANVDVDADHSARHEMMPPGPYVMLAVSDAGCGIEEKILPKIFDPFFTTKEQGKGTGLGLAMAYGAVTQAGGHIQAYSEPGDGTTFRIHLPRIDQKVTAPAVQDALPPPGGCETILLVEDEEALRTIVREVLEDQGYRVIEAASFDEAVAAAHRRLDTIHLLVTDVVLPGMNGRALAEALLAVRPELRVLYMSGYTDDVIAHRGVLNPGTLLLSKPFTALELLRRVHEALEERLPDGSAAGEETSAMA